MKKLLLASSLVLAAACAKADVAWSWWLNNESARPDISFGIASRCAAVETFELSLLYSASPVSEGLQAAFPGINDSDSNCALQFSMWFNRGNKPCVQLGMINCAKAACFTMGLLNISDGTKVQLGFLNFNKEGFLPFFPFVNLDPGLFD